MSRTTSTGGSIRILAGCLVRFFLRLCMSIVSRRNLMKWLDDDDSVPLSNLPRLIVETRKDIEKVGLRSTIRVRLGDGNVLAVIQHTTDEEKGKARRVLDRVVRRAIRLEGTCTGEHGVGSAKRSYLVDELGEDTVRLMRTIKKAVDPKGLFDPGKLYPDSRS
ncbi:FAD-linked oxidase-like protein [Pholiota conissans]|uniref:FAD-linked oxidase-like protein n=1 Tax=Pholiota conissans TaxID=109636 RepID=A0A9P5YV44_9AGAR|nr:FAD-linked oxidase-like protein [Pholiota conissans]